MTFSYEFLSQKTFPRVPSVLPRLETASGELDLSIDQLVLLQSCNFNFSIEFSCKMSRSLIWRSWFRFSLAVRFRRSSVQSSSKRAGTDPGLGGNDADKLLLYPVLVKELSPTSQTLGAF